MLGDTKHLEKYHGRTDAARYLAAHEYALFSFVRLLNGTENYPLLSIA